MNRRVSVIGSVVTMMIVGGMVVYGNRNNAVASDAPFAEATSSGAVLTDAVVATSSVATGVASGMTSSTATLHGVVYPRGAEISYWFEYTADPLLGQILIRRTPRVALITSLDKTLVKADVSALMSSTKYYFRIVAQDENGTVRGDRASFNTK